jgi:hypothetical protein
MKAIITAIEKFTKCMSMDGWRTSQLETRMCCKCHKKLSCSAASSKTGLEDVRDGWEGSAYDETAAPVSAMLLLSENLMKVGESLTKVKCIKEVLWCWQNWLW